MKENSYFHAPSFDEILNISKDFSTPVCTEIAAHVQTRKYRIMYLVDAVGSWQIILPMPNLERAY